MKITDSVIINTNQQSSYVRNFRQCRVCRYRDFYGKGCSIKRSRYFSFVGFSKLNVVGKLNCQVDVTLLLLFGNFLLHL